MIDRLNNMGFVGTVDTVRRFLWQLARASMYAVPLFFLVSLDGSPVREAMASDDDSKSSEYGEYSYQQSTTTSVDAPGTLALMCGGLAMVVFLRRRKRKDR